MKVLFMGTPDFSVPTLDAIVAAGHEVVGVVARPDAPSGRGKKLQSPPTIERARELGLVTWQPRAVRSGPFPEWMEQCGADVAVVVAYGRILTQRLLDAPRLGCVNVHASLLPRYRGAAPVHQAVIHGETETGVCTMRMEAGLDTGPVYEVARTPIGPDETTGELWERLAQLGAQTLVHTLAHLEDLVPTEQDHALATHAPMLSKADGLVDWTASAASVHNLVRGFCPWPGAHTVFRGEPLKVHRTGRLPGEAAPEGAMPGAFVEVGKRVVVATGDGGVIELLSVQLPGKRAVDATSFANGVQPQLGERLG